MIKRRKPCSKSFSCYFIPLLKAIEHDFQNAISSNNLFHPQTIRAPIWKYVKSVCPSFTRMNCDTQFSELLQGTTFLMPGVSDVTTVENNAMRENFSEYNSTGFCSHCKKNCN